MPRILSKTVFYNPPLEQNFQIPFQTANPARANSPEITRQRIREALKATPMPGKVYKVLDHLFDRAGAPDYIAFQRQVKLSNSDKLGIAEELGVSLATVTRAVRLGVQMGWFRVEKRWTRRGRRTLNHYIWCFSPEWHNSSKLTSAPYKEVRNTTVFQKQAEASIVTEASVCLPLEDTRKPDLPTTATPAGPAQPELRDILQTASKEQLSPTSIRTIIGLAKGDTQALEAWAWDRAQRRDPLDHGGGIVHCVRSGEVIEWRRKIDQCRQLEVEAATREAEYQARTASDDGQATLTPTPPTTNSPQPTQEASMRTTTPARIPPGIKREIDELETLAEWAATPELRAQHQAAADELRARYHPGAPAPPARQDRAAAAGPDLANFAGTVN